MKKLCLIPSGVLHRKLKILEKKLIIFETTHFECLPSLLILSDTRFAEITIFTTADSCEQLTYIIRSLQLSLKITWVIQQESNRAFIHKFFRHISRSSYTHLHIGTLEHNMLMFALYLRKCSQLQISMTIHSINGYKSSLFRNVRDISETIAKKILHNSIRHYRVLAPSMVDTFEQAFPSGQVCFIPGNFNKAHMPSRAAENSFTVVIPGTVDAKRRNYKMVAGFFKKNMQKLASFSSVHLILAGNAASPYGKEIAETFGNLSDKNKFSFTCFMHAIPQQLYEALCLRADIIWTPVNIHTKGLRGEKEIYTVTHSPGFITDQIYFGKPAIIPEGLQLPAQFDGCNWEYKDENDLLQIFLSLLSDKSILTEANRKINMACSYFTKENFVAAFNELLAGLGPQ